MPLKSPKVLFTRTSVFSKDNFFPIPLAADTPLSDAVKDSHDVFSDFSTDNDSDSDLPMSKPRFELGCSESSPSKSIDASHRSQTNGNILTSITQNLEELELQPKTHTHESNGNSVIKSVDEIAKSRTHQSAVHSSTTKKEDNSYQICNTPSTKQVSSIICKCFCFGDNVNQFILSSSLLGC